MQRFNPAHQITTQPVLPDNSGYTWIFDSTDPHAWDNTGKQYAKTGSVPTPGPVRGGAMNVTANLTVSCTGQNVTLVLYTLDGAGAWQLYTPPNGTITITAGASPQGVKWDILASDVLIGVLAGASAPSAITSTLYFVERW